MKTTVEVVATRRESAPLVKSFTRLLVLASLGSCLAPMVIVLPYPFREPLQLGLVVRNAFLACAAILVPAGFWYLLRRLQPYIDENASDQAVFLDLLSPKYVGLAVAASAALSLFLELAVIRWQATVFEFFAFYKNFGLLSCFAGLGLGYALSGRDRIPLALVLPLLAWQFAFMNVLRFGPRGDGLRAMSHPPFREQLNMGLSPVYGISRMFAIYFLLAVVFLITALTFVPIGQLCGRLMQRQQKLTAYGWNLLGSVLGVILALLTSYFWTPPLVWFALCFIAVAAFLLRTPASLLLGVGFAILCSITLAWPVDPLWQRLYSPYQLLEIGYSQDSGLMLIQAAGVYYQRVHDLSSSNLSPQATRTRDYYEFPYKTRPRPTSVAIVGAGTGNDVAAALRSSAGHVDAIEIDPAILKAGAANHPEKPYDDPRVSAIVNDARSFLRTTNERYDMIVYGLLDSHTLLSQASSVRLDSFVYTVEGLREARARLKDDGLLSLSFAVLGEANGRKIYLMMKDAFGGRPPVCVRAGYDGSVIFLESNNQEWTVPQAVLERTGFRDETKVYASSSIHADVSTDDWPFFYMPRRVYPISYLLMVVQILLLALFVIRSFIDERPHASHLSFFFLGMGFMLVETKGITEMGLTFGNTWQVIGIVIVSILVMAFLANFTVQSLNVRRAWIPYVLLWASLAVGWTIARSGGLPSTTAGRLGTAIVLTCPLFFSGIVFSTQLAAKGEIAEIMAMNLFGAICGGLLEYNSMYFGFQSLYLMAIACYLLAFGADVPTMKAEVVRTLVTSSTAAD